MDKNEFYLVLQTITIGLINKIIVETGFYEDIAMEKLYTSELYSVLEKEETKVWHYSVPKLYDLWINETKTGQLSLPAF